MVEEDILAGVTFAERACTRISNVLMKDAYCLSCSRMLYQHMISVLVSVRLCQNMYGQGQVFQWMRALFFSSPFLLRTLFLRGEPPLSSVFEDNADLVCSIVPNHRSKFLRSLVFTSFALFRYSHFLGYKFGYPSTIHRDRH